MLLNANVSTCSLLMKTKNMYQHRDKFYRIKIKCLKYQMNQEIYFRGICYISDEIIMKHISLKSSNACMDMKFCQYGP